MAKSTKVSTGKKMLNDLLDQWGKKTNGKNLKFLKKKIKKFKSKKKNKPHTWEHFLVYAQKKGILDKLKPVKKDKKRKKNRGSIQVKPSTYVIFFISTLVVITLLLLSGYCINSSGWRKNRLPLDTNKEETLKKRLFVRQSVSKAWLEKEISEAGAILFQVDSTLLLNDAEKRKIQKIVSSINRFKEVSLEITGYAHSVGNPASEQSLALRRAGFIASQIESASGIELSIVTKSGGSSNPVADDTEPRKRHLNRRVEISVKKAK
jgi:outer membrane protein OmpA-like peptidoglycan-associated protein